MIGHVTPEAFEGGPIALVNEGDTITIDMKTRMIDLVSRGYHIEDLLYLKKSLLYNIYI